MKPALFLSLFAFLAGNAFSEVKLPNLISDHMVIQQKATVRIWGTAGAGEKIEVSIAKQKLLATADQKGNWQVMLQPITSATALTMTVKGTNTITVSDILPGEVWVASGQSNMEWEVQQSDCADEEIKNSTNDKIRLFVVKKGTSDTLVSEAEGKWELCSPTSTPSFSAVGYFFARDLFASKKQPIGMIESDWGATSCEPWTPMEAMKEDPKLAYTLRLVRPHPAGKPIDKMQPSVIYNYMIHPLTKYAIKGVIWYQGEQNAYVNVSFPYRYLFPDMITAWRKNWGQGDFPFLFVQLSAFTKHPYWPQLRESQLETTKLLKNAGMAVSIDLGDSTNAHFKDKQPLGIRLSLAARHFAYGENIEYSGPVLQKFAVEGDKIRLWFDHAKVLKPSSGKELTGFTLAAADGKHYPAKAEIQNGTIVLSSDQVKSPTIVHYAYVDWPTCNLVNGEGLPASPFRTDVHDEL